MGQPKVTIAISIHAPAKGATYKPSQFDDAFAISIHAPAKGATCYRWSGVMVDTNFNPRPREGSDMI